MPLCPICLANHPAYLDFCPTERAYDFKNKVSLPKKDFFGASPSLFVGRFGYPNVRMGLLANESVPTHAESPRTWSAKNLPIQDVAEMRSSLINSYNTLNIKSFSTRFVSTMQEVAQAKSATDVEVKLNKLPKFSMNFSDHRMPHGPAIVVKKAETTSNPKIPKPVDKAVSDTDLKSAEALQMLYKKGLEESYLTRILSSASLGVGKNRKFVPTRWSITAVDDTVGKNLLQEIKTFPLADFAVYSGGGWGNFYIALLYPKVFSYELFETMVRSEKFGTDYESFQGRKKYATNTVGGYYAARLAVLETLQKRKRQASVLLLRFITDDYWMPLGVWVCREAARKCMASKPLKFTDEKSMMHFVQEFIKKRFKIPINKQLAQSRLLDSLKQRSLFDF